MRGLWLEDGRLSVREDLPPPVPSADEALIRPTLAGVCATDLELVRGYYPYAGVLGHELVGEVVEARSAPEWVGKRVVGEINAACRRCPTCQAGRPTHCPSRTVLGIVGGNGCFAEALALPIDNLHEVPEGVTDEAAVFCEPLAAALEIQEQVTIGEGDRVAVVGAGRLGQLIAQSLATTGCHLEVVARHDRQRQRLLARGITTTMTLEPATFDVAVEATGVPAGFDIARRAIRPRGTLVLKSTYAGKLELDASALVVDEITLVGSRCGPFAPALELLAQGRCDPTPLIDARYPLSDALAAMTHAAAPGALKVLLEL